MSDLVSYHFQVGDAKGDYDGRGTLRAALSDAYAAAAMSDLPVTIFEADPDVSVEGGFRYKALAVISALPVSSS